MASLLLIFFASCFVSFIGSLQVGPVNLFVINTTFYASPKRALWVAVGGSLPEFVYCGLAVYATSFFKQSPLFDFYFKLIFAGILLLIAFIFFFKKQKVIVLQNENSTKSSFRDFFKGFALASLNPQLLPFWIVVKLYFNSVKFLEIKSEVHNFSFILGSGIGAFMLLLFLIMIVKKYKTKFEKYINQPYYFKIISLLFFIIALQQLFSLND